MSYPTLPDFTFPTYAKHYYALGRQHRRQGFTRASGPDNPRQQMTDAERKVIEQLGWNAGLWGDLMDHYVAGWDDEKYRWPDRGWEFSMFQAYKQHDNTKLAGYPRPLKLALLYTKGWQMAAENPAWSPDLTWADPPITADEARREMEEAKRTLITGGTPPAQGYIEPGLIPTTGSPATTAIQPFNTGTQPQNLTPGVGGLGSLGPLILLGLLNKAKTTKKRRRSRDDD